MSWGWELFSRINPIDAYVNHGRLIAECPRCRWAIEIDASWGGKSFLCGRLPDGRMTVTGCGYSAEVQMDSEMDDVLAVLRVRPLPNQNWQKGETVADLRMENASRRLRSGLERE